MAIQLSAWERAYAAKRRVFYEPETQTIRQCPENYCLLVWRDGDWRIDIDKASTINAHSMRMVIGGEPCRDGLALARLIEVGFFGEVR